MEKTHCGNIKKTTLKTQMEQSYDELLSLFNMEAKGKRKEFGIIIRRAIDEFVRSCQTPAIWCYGEHTRMLMTDYIFELKPVRYIIDERYAGTGIGFEVIRSESMEEKHIDGIIISTFKYRDEIVHTIRSHFSHIKYLDIYQILHEEGIDLDCEYYATEYPYAHYKNINKLKTDLTKTKDSDSKDILYEELLKEFISVKDFRTAISCMDQYIKERDSERNRKISDHLNRLYALELQAASDISEKNVLMLCIDGLRREDLFSGQMKKIKEYVDTKGYFFRNAYSVSTSTYESLIPAYSGNQDLRTKYYLRNEIEEADCPFITEAIRQNRTIHFYTDCCQYIKSNHIHLKDRYQTAAEKVWDFLLDAVDEKNGLFYVHILYESHYSYPNPYTEAKLVAEGTSIFFDFLKQNGGQIKTDYICQHNDAVKYLDDLLAPILERLSCKTVIFADHGNVLLEANTGLENVKYTQLTFGRELIEVPLIVFSKETGTGVNDNICSIMDLNDMMIHLLSEEKIADKNHPYIKIVRSELYNADFKYLYKKLGYSQGLKAFEAFLFPKGHKLVIYEDGMTELYDMKTDEKLENINLIEELYMQVKDEITVCI